MILEDWDKIVVGLKGISLVRKSSEIKNEGTSFALSKIIELASINISKLDLDLFKENQTARSRNSFFPIKNLW